LFQLFAAPNYMPFAGAEMFVYEQASVRAENKFGSDPNPSLFFELRSGTLIFPHMKSTIKIHSQFEIYAERSKIFAILHGSTYLQLGFDANDVSRYGCHASLFDPACWRREYAKCRTTFIAMPCLVCIT
jgi:hypothetical protein